MLSTGTTDIYGNVSAVVKRQREAKDAYYEAKMPSYHERTVGCIRMCVAAALTGLFEFDDFVIPEDVDIEYPHVSVANIAVPCMKFSKVVRKSPQDIAQLLSSENVQCEFFIYTVDDVTASATNGYLNFKHDRGAAFSVIVDELFSNKRFNPYKLTIEAF